MRDKRGTSLVEILVVMVVLLVGIMTIIQMFPSGFRVVRAGESKSIATRLAQAELERWKSMTGSIPEALLPVDENGNVINTQEPGPKFDGWYQDGTDAAGKPVYKRGNAYNFRYVVGETTYVPAPSYFGTGGGTWFGACYTVAFSPIDVTRNSDGTYNGLSIKGGDMRRNVRYDEQYVDLRPGNYAVNYHPLTGSPGDFEVAFPSDNASHRIYYVSYSYWVVDGDGNRQLISRVDDPVASSSGSWSFAWHTVSPPTPAGCTIIGIEEGSDTCARGFTEHVAGLNGHDNTDWCFADPYEFKLADPIIGTIAFNPNGHSAYEYTALGLRPLQARISYRRYDTRIIREDKVVPGPSDPNKPDADIPMKMSLRFIMAIGDSTDNINEETYTGLIHSAIADIPLPVYVIDIASGLQVDLPTDYLGKIDYKAGIVTLPAQADLIDWNGDKHRVTLAGRQLRFFYRSDGDWSVFCTKACSLYSRIYDSDPNLDTLIYNTYYLEDATKRVYFSRCQANQTVSVDYAYGPDPNASGIPDSIKNAGEHRVTGYAAQIQEDQDDVSHWHIHIPIPVTPGDVKYYRIARISVSGLSFRATVVWRDGKSWRNVNLDTALSRQ